MLRRGGYHNQFFQRFGIFDKTTIKRIGQGRLWIHATSVGETFIALKFIKLFQERNPQAHFLLSITTTTGLEIAQQQASSSLEVIANPIDFSFTTHRIINLFHPSALIMVEADVWPERLFYCKKKGIPTAIITARLSPRSESRFLQFRKIIQPLFNSIDLIAVPTTYDEKRWESLGINPSHLKITGNIKFDQHFDHEITPPEDLLQVFSSLGWNKSDPVLLGGSLHAGEEEILTQAWLQLRKRFPNLRLIIAPRHVERRQEIVSLLQKYQLSIALRSEQTITPSDVFILDTTGELVSWYTIATIVFIGKSLGVNGAYGGQNPVEPLSLDRPVLTGPFMEKFEPLISELRSADGVITVKHADEIAIQAEQLLLSPEKASTLVKQGLETLHHHQGSTGRTCELIEELCRQ